MPAPMPAPRTDYRSRARSLYKAAAPGYRNAACGRSLLLKITLDFNRVFGIGAGTTLDARFLVTVFGAGDAHVIRIHVLAKTRNLVNTHDVSTRDQRAAVLERRCHLGVGYAGAVDFAHEAEIRLAAVFIGIVVAEA